MLKNHTREHTKEIESRYSERDSVSLVDRVANLGFWECDFQTGLYTGFGFTEKLISLTGKTHPRIEDMLPFIHPEDRDDFSKRHQLQFEGEGYNVEFRMVVQDKIRYMQSATEIVSDSEGRPIRALGFIQEITRQKLDQLAREKSEQQYRTLFHDPCYAIWLMHPDGSFVECNSTTLKTYKANGSEAIADQTFASLAPLEQPDGTPSQQRAKTLIQAALESGHNEFEWLAKGLDDKPFWAFISLTRLHLDDQDLLQVILHDIDQEKRSQIKLIDSEKKYKALFENASFAAWILSPEGTFIDCNSHALKLVGAKSKEMLLRSTPMDISPPYQPDGKSSAEKIEEKRQILLRDGHCDFDWLHRRFDGTEFWAHVNLSILSIGGTNYTQALVQDIDKEKLAQKLLQEGEMRKQFIIKNAGLSMWVWDLQTGKASLTDESDRLGELFPIGGILVNEMVEKVHEEDREIFREKAYGLAAGQMTNVEFEYRYPNPGGGWIWIRTSGMVVECDEKGKPTVAIGFHQDVTERRKYEAGLLEAQKTTEEANEAKSQFLANMSHEIRTPMTAILGYLDLICGEDITHTEREEYVQTIRRNGMYLLDLINDILDLSKIESGETGLSHSYIHLAQIIDTVVSPLEALANEKTISLILDYKTKIPEKVWTDARFLRQILWNIIGNAIKFTDEGGILIAIEYLPAEDQEEGMEKETKLPLLKIRVQDTGCGIPPEQFEAIFNPFVQADATATRQFSGTGLGLAIVRRQIEALNGTIRVWNNETGGATFEIIHPLEKYENIPLIQPEQFFPVKQDDKKTKEITPTTLQGVTILLAEDGMDNQRLISTVLRKAGAVVDIANNGQEAIEMIQAADPEKYDLILMDMQMPLLDGYTATSRLREQNVATPIIALTAHAMSGDRKKCLESGCDSYCTKPIRPQKLIALITRYIQNDFENSPQETTL